MNKTLQVLVSIFLVLLVIVTTILLTLQSIRTSDSEDTQIPAFAGGSIDIPITKPASCANNFSENFNTGLSEKLWQGFSLPNDTSTVYQKDGYLTGDSNLSILNVSTTQYPRIIRGQSTQESFTGNFSASVDVQMIAEENDTNKAASTWLMAYDNYLNRFGVGIQIDKSKTEAQTTLEVSAFTQKQDDIWSSSYQVSTFASKTFNINVKRINNIVKFYFEVDGVSKHVGTYNNVFTGPVKFALYNEVNTNGQISNVVSAFDNFNIECSDSSEVTSKTIAECSIQKYSDEFTTINTNFWQAYVNENDPTINLNNVYFQATPVVTNSKLLINNLYFAQAQELSPNQKLIKGAETTKAYVGDFRVSVDAQSILDEHDTYDVSEVMLVAYDASNFKNQFGVGYATKVNENLDAQPVLQSFSQDSFGIYNSRRNTQSNNSLPTKFIFERIGSKLKTVITRGSEVVDVTEYEGAYEGSVNFAIYALVSSEQPLTAKVEFDNFELSCPELEASTDLVLLSDTFTLSEALSCTPLDIDNDGVLSLVDLANFAEFYGKGCIASNESNNAICGSIDTNNDGNVDINDLSSFATSYSLNSCQ